LERAGFLTQLAHLVDDLLELFRHEVEERLHLFLVVTPQLHREAVPPNIQWRDSHAGSFLAMGRRSPNSARPTRISVAPSSMATSKSSDIPMESSRSVTLSKSRRSDSAASSASP